jgi:superoxide dismutase, Cu-Zn family
MKKLFALAAAAALFGCHTLPDENARATAQLAPTPGNQTAGEATFDQVGSKVRVVVVVQGLKPGQEHGLHIHEVGDCGNAAENAKGHFNPASKSHGSPSDGNRHAGDLPALAANQQGRAKVQADVDMITLGSGSGSVLGRALVVHADPDDYKTQPAGNSGARIACGVIRRG